MNISFNINAANLVGGLKGSQKAPGKSITESSPESASSSETFEVSGTQSQPESSSAVPSLPILNVGAAEQSAGFLKNVIIALPALVLRGQANIMQQSMQRLLQ